MKKALSADISDVISDSNIPWRHLGDSTILVTGATGLVGGALVRALSAANIELRLNLRLIGHGRNREKGKTLSRECGTAFIYGDIRSPALSGDIPGRLDYIFHCAANTKSADMAANPLEVIATAVDGARNILELATERQNKSLVYLSSMEVYGQTALSEVSETDLGFLDLFSPRSSYPESKRFCEMICAIYARQGGLPVKIARLAQTFGAGTPKDDARVFAQFARNAMSGESIELHTEGNSRGNYCSVSDTIRALLIILLEGMNGEAYNIANPNASMTIREMAEIVAAEICGGKIPVVVNVPEDILKRGYAPDVGYKLNVDKLKCLGWTPKHGLHEMYRRLLEDWRR